MDSRFPLRVLPYMQNEQFFGRAGELQQLSNWLDPSNTASTCPGPRTVLLYGMGGVGKTQLALQYAYTCKVRYDAVFWLNCETSVALAQSCREVVQRLGLAIDPQPTDIERILFSRWLADTDRAYLLIMDNLDEHDQILSEIWPLKFNNGSIIATSRRPDFGAPFAFSVQVLPFDVENGSKFLLSLLDTEDSSPGANLSLNLSERLGGHALAIVQMASEIRRRRWSVSQFLHFYEAHQTKIDRRPTGLASYTYNLGSVWLLSFKTLSHESYRLLGIISHLAPDSIPATLLCQDPSKLFEFGEAVWGLTSSSLIQKHSNNSEIDVFSIHRLVQQAFRDHLSLQERSTAFNNATLLVFNAVQSKAFGDTTPSKETYEILQPHIDHLEVLPEARTSETLASLLSYATKPEASLLDDNQSVPSDDTMQDRAFSDVDSVSSQSSVFAEETRSVTSLLVEVFRNDILFVESARQLLANVNEDKFHQDFSDLLTLFSKDLRAEPILNAQPQSTDWIESRRHLISQKFVAFLKPSSGNSLTQLPPRQENDHLILERYLERLDPATDGPAQPWALSNPSYNATLYYPDDLSLEHLYLHSGQDARNDNDRDFETRIEHLEALVSQSSAFEKLKRNLSRINKPHKCDVDGCDRNDGFSTVSELEQHKISRHRTVSRVSRTGNLVDNLRIVLALVQFWIACLGLILRGSVIAATQGREQPSPANMVRGQWICACGEVIVDDFHESVPGCVASAMSELSANQNFQPFSTNIMAVESTRNFFSSLNDRIGLLATWVSTITATLKRKFGGSGSRDRVESSEVQEPDELPIANALPPRYLLVCISMWKGYYFTQMLPVDLNVSNDEILFCQLKLAYHRQVGICKRMLSLRCIKDMRFVRFQMTRSKLVDINLHSRMEGRIRETLPPANHSDYSYNPKPICTEPPVGHSTMIHLYCCPKSSGGLNFCLKRFPGYCQEQVRMKEDADEELAWGIELVEGRDWVYLWVIGFLILSFSIAFGIGWAVVRKDVSGGFTVAGTLMTTFTCLVGTIQVALEAL